MAELTEQDRVNLGWMIRCNSGGIGFLGPTVRKIGRLPELAHLITGGLATVDEDNSPSRGRGYWITDAGREALQPSCHESVK